MFHENSLQKRLDSSEKPESLSGEKTRFRNSSRFVHQGIPGKFEDAAKRAREIRAVNFDSKRGNIYIRSSDSRIFSVNKV